MGIWFTCTPVRFKGDHTFFARDSGLLCKGFQEIGVACKAIMPGPPMEDDQVEDLIRTDYRNLEDPGWWETLGGEGVVFYGWGSGKYVKIVRAIKQAGLVLVSHMDTAGMLGVLNGFSTYAKTVWRVSRGEHRNGLAGLLHFAARLVYATSVGLIGNDRTRARHLKQADWIGAITPVALERIRKVCRIYGGDFLAGRVQLVPHPNATCMVPDPSLPKERLVVGVGRWDDPYVKGTDLLLATAERLLQQDAHVCFEIYGRMREDMHGWHQNLPVAIRDRVKLMGVVRNSLVSQALQRARVEICTSLRESYHIVSAEALCCGCSVVGPDVAEIPGMKWFTDGPFGRMAGRTADGMAEAVLAELADWDAGRRSAEVIAAHWSVILHAPQVAERILQLAERQGEHSANSLPTPLPGIDL